MSDYRVLIIVLFFSSVYCDDCVTFDFEKDFNISFNNEGVCDGMATWNVGIYENLPIDSPHPESSKFVYPHEKLSCSSSFTFQMAASGVLEVNLFMSPTLDTDQVMIMASQILPDANNAVVGLGWILASEENFISGWRTVKISLTGLGTFSGFITLFGMKSPGSIVLIDSFRYVGPSSDKDSCVIYDETETTTTTSQLPTKETPITTPENPKTTTAGTSISTPTMTTPDEFPTTTTTETSTTTTKIPTTITTETSTTTKIIPTTTPQETPITTPENPKTTISETSKSTPAMTTPNEFPTTTTTETSMTTKIIPTTTPQETSITTTEIPKTTTTETSKSTKKIPSTTPKETSTTTKEILTTKPNVAPTTTTENMTETLKTTTTTTSKETSTTSTEIQTTKTTETPTTSVTSPSTSTERPRLSVSILLIKIQKFFK